jgi:hypothetical protein
MGVLPFYGEEVIHPDASQSVLVDDNSIIFLKKCPFLLTLSLNILAPQWRQRKMNNNLLQNSSAALCGWVQNIKSRFKGCLSPAPVTTLQVEHFGAWGQWHLE